MLKLNISGGRVLEQLKLPVPPDEFKRKVDEIRAAGQPNIVPTVLNADSSVPALNWHLQQTRLDSDSTLQKLNQLAETIDGMNAAEHYHLSKSLDPESQQSLDDVLRIAAHIKPASLDCYEVIPGVTSHQELGRWLVEHDRLEDKVPETLRPYLDYRSIGIDYCNSHEGEFLADSYTGIQSGAMEQVLEEQGLLPLDTITVEDANTLALCLQEMEQEDGELMKFCAVLEVEQPGAFTEAVSIAMDRDDYELVPEDMDEYGKQVLRRTGADDEVIDTIDGYMDFSRLGEDSMAEDGVRRTEFGLARRLSKPFPPAPEIGQAMM